MFSFDYEYWGILREALEKGEDVVQDLACQYKLSMNVLCNIEEAAKENAQELFSCSNNFDNLTNLINTEKIKTTISLICEKNKLDENDFDYEVDGDLIEVIYKKERIA